MINSEEVKNKMISMLDSSRVEYKLFQHQPVFSYEDAEKAAQETGYIGTEGKSLVMKADDSFIVYVTIQGKKVNFDAIKEKLDVKKVRLASPEELQEYFGAQPGCAYPFGFDAQYAIYVDPIVYQQEWFVFSPCLPNFTVQAKGSDLKKVFDSLENHVEETEEFNI